jgi:hypothetical protein
LPASGGVETKLIPISALMPETKCMSEASFSCSSESAKRLGIPVHVQASAPMTFFPCSRPPDAAQREALNMRHS